MILTDNIASADNVDNDINDENGDNCDTAGHGDIAENDDIRIPKLDTDNNISKAKPTKVAKDKEDQSINVYLRQSTTTKHLQTKKVQIKNTRHAIVYS